MSATIKTKEQASALREELGRYLAGVNGNGATWPSDLAIGTVNLKGELSVGSVQLNSLRFIDTDGRVRG